MGDLISREALSKVIRGMFCRLCNSCEGIRCMGCTVNVVLSTIKNAPAEDAAGVVRCKDCGSFKPSPYVSYKYPEIGWCMIEGCHKRPDYYCATGKRRETNAKGDNNGIQEAGTNGADS